LEKLAGLSEESLNINQFQQDLLNWYYENARVLPWRSDPKPYYVWISEIMLQQTRVDTVIPYFTKFISELPTIKALAGVEEEKLLKLWQGLGYYNRALNLKRAAQILVEEHQGQLPSAVKELMFLPGIGAYTAGAIASIAFGEAVPAVDGNVLRIMARLLESREDINNAKVKKEMQTLVSQMIFKEHPGDFNQALMDLGATVCLPNGEPKCDKCPVNTHCRAYKNGLTAAIPVKVEKKARNIDKKTVFVIFSKGYYALRKRGAGGLLPNLWEFPNEEGYWTENQCRNFLDKMRILPEKIVPIKTSKHIFSHREWHMKGFFIIADADLNHSDFTWVTKEEMDNQYSIPTAFKEFIKLCE